MENFAIYLGKSALWITGFTLVYFLFLRNERFFILKRIYLIAGIIASFIFPLISFHYPVEVQGMAEVIPEIGLTPAPGESTSRIMQAVPESTIRLNSGMMIPVLIYLAGLLFLVSRVIRQADSLYKRINSARISHIGCAKLIRTHELSSPFTFFNYVFISPSVNEAELEPIMKHELVHVRQKHWLDLLLLEIICLFQWLNPFIWIYGRYIRLNHEYIADHEVLQSSTDPAVYKAVLLNQMFSLPVITLSNSFNYSINKTRFEMMKNVITSPWRKLKILWVLPFIAFVFYEFATPEYKYASKNNTSDQFIVYASEPVVQDVVKGIVVDENGNPLQGVNVGSTGTVGNAKFMNSDAGGRFVLVGIEENAVLSFSFRGYKSQSLKPDFKKEMNVVMVKDPGYKEPQTMKRLDAPVPITVLDGVITDQPAGSLISKLGDELGTIVNLRGKEATDKYGDAGENGVTEIYTKKKAAELGIKIPFRRKDPEDFPTFQGKSSLAFTEWLVKHVDYPEEARAKGIQGRITANYTIEPDGSVGEVSTMGNADPLLSNAAIKAIRSSPAWDPPKNPKAVKEPFTGSLSIQFKLPDIIIKDNTFVAVENMPLYPGGAEAMLKFISGNLEYPNNARENKIEGRVIVRFIVNTEGNAEEPIILKGVNSELDREALRVVSLLKGFKPGSQNGEAVNVYYMVPINFSLGQVNEPAKP